MRKYYFDNLRWMAVLLLFPYHAFRIYDSSIAEGFYIKGLDVTVLSGFLVATRPWFMPLLFVIAGISSYYALQKRNAAQYIKERLTKLLIPCVAGILLLVPAQTFFAERFHNGYTGGYFYQYIMFFTKSTDLTGNSGGFTPGHLWFLLYLFVISLVALPFMLAYYKSGRKLSLHKVSLPVLFLFFLLPMLANPILDPGRKSFGEYFAYFILGFFILSDDSILQRADKYRFPLLALSIAGMLAELFQWNGILSNTSYTIQNISYFLFAWIMILAILGLGRHNLNFKNNTTGYLSNASFPVYIFHQSWLITVAYYTFIVTDNVVIQILLILAISIAATFATYELCKRFRITRFLFGIKTPGAAHHCSAK